MAVYELFISWCLHVSQWFSNLSRYVTRRFSSKTKTSGFHNKVHIALSFETGSQRVRVKASLKQLTRNRDYPFRKTTFDITLKYDILNPVLQGYIEKSTTINEKERVDSRTKFRRFISAYRCLDLLDRIRVLGRPDMEDEIKVRDIKSLLSMFKNIIDTDVMFLCHKPGTNVCGTY